MNEQSMLKILLIESDPETAALVRNIFSSASGCNYDVQWTQTLLPGLDRLAQGDIEVVLLELDGSRGLDAVSALRMHAPALPIILLCNLESESSALRALEIGAQDYLIKNRLDSEALIRTVRCAVVRHKVQAIVKQEGAIAPSRVIGCLGAKGGVGTTAVACLSSLELKRQTGQRVLLADLNLSGGLIGFLTKANSSYSFLDAANDLLRLDRSFWEKVVSDGPEELEVLPSLASTCAEPQVLLDRGHCVLRFLRTVYSWTVLDLGRLNQFSASVLSDLTDLLLVTHLDPAAIFQTRQTVQRLRELDFELSRITLVVNQVPKMDFVPALELPKVLGISGCAILPEGPVDLLNGRNIVRSHLARLAARLAGVEQKSPSWKRLPLLSFFSANRELEAA